LLLVALIQNIGCKQFVILSIFSLASRPHIAVLTERKTSIQNWRYLSFRSHIFNSKIWFAMIYLMIRVYHFDP
jgi:hypothetical protein